MARVMLDTNVYILGYGDPHSVSARVLDFLHNNPDFEILLSNEIVDEIRRVARRVGGKDWAGAILNRIWRDLNLEIVALPDERQDLWEQYMNLIPREDLDIFLTASLGLADLFVSSNRELIRSAATQMGFRCLTPAEFLERYRAD